MTRKQPVRRNPARHLLVVAVLLATAGVTTALGHRAQNAASAPPVRLLASSVASPPSPVAAAPSTAPRSAPRSTPRGALGEADGAVPDGVSVFDSSLPAVARLDPALLGALRRAATDAAKDGVTFSLNSGWRSAAYQDKLLREAVATYGSAEAAARWVATAATSPHVSGDAVDIGPAGAAAWLSRHGAAYGLCQIYRNEPWHYELRPVAIKHRCPTMYADPTKDPRMQP